MCRAAKFAVHPCEYDLPSVFTLYRRFCGGQLSTGRARDRVRCPPTTLTERRLQRPSQVDRYRPGARGVGLSRPQIDASKASNSGASNVAYVLTMTTGGHRIRLLDLKARPAPEY